MKKNFTLFTGLICLTVCLMAQTALSQPSKVDVCHSEGNGSFHLINISDRAYQTHIDHGDASPGSPVPGAEGKIFGEDCELLNAPIYDSIPAVYPGSFPSLGYEATSTDEFGDHIFFAGSARNLKTVELSLTDWACENDGTRASDEACVSTPGSSFNHPITLNLYSVDYTSGDPEPGSLIGTITQNFTIPYRPSWDPSCPDPTTDVPFGGTWFDPVLGFCVHGYAFNLTFDFSGLGIVLPDEVIFGVEYNTQTHGDNPLNTTGPYNSLNVSLTTDAPSIGINWEADTAFWDTSFGPFYCDGGSGGTDIFRRDAGCWETYTPVVRFTAE